MIVSKGVPLKKHKHTSISPITSAKILLIYSCSSFSSLHVNPELGSKSDGNACHSDFVFATNCQVAVGGFSVGRTNFSLSLGVAVCDVVFVVAAVMGKESTEDEADNAAGVPVALSSAAVSISSFFTMEFPFPE